MLLYGEGWVKDVVLWAEADFFTDIVHVVADVLTE